jgi:hypothetical protein
MENKEIDSIIGALVILLIVGIIIFNIYLTIKCWNIPIAERTGWCAMQYLPK